MHLCPYCDSEITKEKTCSFYNNNDDFFSGTSPDSLIATISNAVFQKHGGEGSKYFEYWKSKFGIESDMIKNSTSGIVLRRDVINMAIDKMDKDELERYNIQLITPNMYQIGEYEIDFNYVDPDKTLSACEMPLVKKTGGDRRTPYALICPECENLLPLDYFEKDCVNIILTGASSVGKTVFVMSMLQNNFINLTGNTGRLKITRSMENCDVCTRQFFDDLSKFDSSGDLPPGTSRPLPPLFLSFEWSLPHRATYKHNLCLIDTEGERWENGKNKNTVAPFIRECDGMIYVVEPSQGIYSDPPDTPRSNGGAPSRGSHREARVVRPQSSDNLMDDRSEAKKGTADYIYKRYFNVNDSTHSKMYCAFVLSKLDRYLGEGKYQSAIDTSEIPFWHNLTSYDEYSTSDSRTQIFDSARATYNCIAAYKLLHLYFKMPIAQNCSFGNIQWFAVSSFSGEAKRREQGGKPYVDQRQQSKTLNIHEPLMWLLSEIIPKKQAERKAAEEEKARRETTVEFEK